MLCTYWILPQGTPIAQTSTVLYKTRYILDQLVFRFSSSIVSKGSAGGSLSLESEDSENISSWHIHHCQNCEPELVWNKLCKKSWWRNICHKCSSREKMLPGWKMENKFTNAACCCLTDIRGLRDPCGSITRPKFKMKRKISFDSHFWGKW